MKQSNLRPTILTLIIVFLPLHAVANWNLIDRSPNTIEPNKPITFHQTETGKIYTTQNQTGSSDKTFLCFHEENGTAHWSHDISELSFYSHSTDTSNTMTSQTTIMHFAQSQWNQIGPTIASPVGKRLHIESLAIVNDTPCFAYIELNSNWLESDDLYVKQWNGSNWIQLGNKINFSQDVVQARLKTGPDGTLYICFVELKYNNGFTSKAYIHVKQFNGTNWVSVGDALNGEAIQDALYEMTFALSKQGQLYVWYNEGLHYCYVKTFQNNRWTTLGNIILESPDACSGNASIAFTSNGSPILSYMESGQSNSYWLIKQWEQSKWITTHLSTEIVSQHQHSPDIQILNKPDGSLYSLHAHGGTITVKHYVTAEHPADVPLPPKQDNYEHIAYPNPAQDNVIFSWQEQDPDKAMISIYNINGARIASITETKPFSSISWNTQNITTGIYLYQIILTVEGQTKALPPGKFAVAH